MQHAESELIHLVAVWNQICRVNTCNQQTSDLYLNELALPKGPFKALLIFHLTMIFVHQPQEKLIDSVKMILAI